MSIDEVLRQMEEYQLRREERDYRPTWLKEFIQRISTIFEPLTDAGRVGYECETDEDGWIVCMYLGTTEIIGGPRDGQIDHVSFRLNIQQLVAEFSATHRVEAYSIANDADDRFNEPIRCVIVVHGLVEEQHAVKLEILTAPPKYVAPGLHRGPGGEIIAR